MEVMSIWHRVRGITTTTLLVRVPAAELAASLAHTHAAGDTPTHVTISYPFPRTALSGRMPAALASLFADYAPFGCELNDIRKFEKVAYLAPRDPSGFRTLAEAVQQRFPGNPLYGGVYDSYIPHAAIGPLGALTPSKLADVAGLLPIRFYVHEVELWALRRGRWIHIRNFPLLAERRKAPGRLT